MATEIKTQEKENRLLSYEERDILGEVATKDPPDSQRAQALLAIDEGATQAAAGQQAGLTKGQVRYWLGKFHKDGTAIFPEELLSQAQPEDADPSPSQSEPIASTDKPELGQEAGAEEAQQELPDVEDTAGAVDEAVAEQEVAPKAKKKPKKKPKKKSKKSKKPKKDKKTKKGKQPKKKKSKKKRKK